MNIDTEIKMKEIELAKLKLKKQFGELGKMPIGSERALIAFLTEHEVRYPQRVYVVNDRGASDYACLKDDGELCVGGYRHNDRQRDGSFSIKVDHNGDAIFEESINAKQKVIRI